MRNGPEMVEVNSTQLEDVLRRVEKSLDEKDTQLIRAAFESYVYAELRITAATGCTSPLTVA